MAVTDLWLSARTGEPTKRHGVGMRYRVSVVGHPSKSFRVKAAAKAYEESAHDDRGVGPRRAAHRPARFPRAQLMASER